MDLTCRRPLVAELWAAELRAFLLCLVEAWITGADAPGPVFDLHLDPAALAEGRIREVDAVLAHAARVPQRVLAELLLLLR